MGDAADLPAIMSDVPLPPPPPHDPDILAIVEATLDQRPPPAEAVARFAEGADARTAEAERQRARDWPDLARYHAANRGIAPPELVMIGDSLTEIWGLATPELFGPRIVNRGISGQTSPQILLRFMADVVDLAPRAVHILCGTNDIAGNTGPNTPDDYRRNIRAMVTLARANGIRVLLGSLTPVLGPVAWSPQAQPERWVPLLNAWLRTLAAECGATFVDYHALLADADGRLRQRYSADGVHLTRAAYGEMRSLLEETLARR